MKTKEILEWAIREGIDFQHVNTIHVPSNQTEEWWYETLGGAPPCEIEGGEYIYSYISDMVGKCWGEDYMYPDATIEVEGAFSPYGTDYILLFKVEN